MKARFTTSKDGIARRNISVTLRLDADEVAKLERIRGQNSSAKSLTEFLSWKLEDALFMVVEHYDQEQASEAVVRDYVKGSTG